MFGWGGGGGGEVGGGGYVPPMIYTKRGYAMVYIIERNFRSYIICLLVIFVFFFCKILS